MRVHVVNLDPGAPKRAPVVERDVDTGIDDVLWVPIPRTVAPLALDQFIVAQAPSVALQSEAVVLGLTPETTKELANYPDVFSYVHRRVELAPVYTARIENGTPVLVHEAGDSIAEFDLAPDRVLGALREADMGTLLRRGGAELPAHEILHYEGPNGRHYPAFLRPGLALRGLAELDRAAFWLVEYLGNRFRFLADHWSLTSLAYHLGGYLARLGVGGRPVQVEALTSYDEDHDVLVGRLIRSFRGDDRALGVIVSVNSSGHLARRMMAAASEAGFDAAAAALCWADADCEYPVAALCGLGPDFRASSWRACEDCGKGSVVVPVEHDTYLLALAAYVREDAVTEPDAVDGKEFFSRYGGTGVSWVHRDHLDGRHHAFYLDVEAIVDHPAFEERLAATVAPWGNEGIDLVLCPGHPAAGRLAEKVGRLLDAPVICREETGLGECEAADIERLLSAKRICVVDDVVITGNRLYRYRNRLIQLRRRMDRDCDFDLYCVVAIARPPDEPTLRGLQDVTHHRKKQQRFSAVESLLLPHWAERTDCPWCEELHRLKATGVTTGAIAERIKRLDRGDGLRERLFLPWSAGGDLTTREPITEAEWAAASAGAGRDARSWELNSGSVFGDVQDADVMISVAAAIQRLRSKTWDGGGWRESRLDDVFRSPVAKTLDRHLYLTGRYYEPVLVAAFLRGVRRHDLRAPSHEQELVAAVRDHLLRSSASTELRSELVLAMARGVLPPIPDFSVETADPAAEASITHALSLLLPSAAT